MQQYKKNLAWYRTIVDYSLQQTEEVHDVLRADFAPVGHQSVCEQIKSYQKLHSFLISCACGVQMIPHLLILS